MRCGTHEMVGQLNLVGLAMDQNSPAEGQQREAEKEDRECRQKGKGRLPNRYVEKRAGIQVRESSSTYVFEPGGEWKI